MKLPHLGALVWALVPLALALGPRPAAGQDEPTPSPPDAAASQPPPPATEPASGEAREPGAPPAQGGSRVDYEIEARVDPFAREEGGVELTRWRLTGRETIRWTNGSDDEVSDLRFHLYLNAFANNRSIHMLETGQDLRGARVGRISDEFWWGYQDVKALRVDGVDVTASLRYEQPDAAEGDPRGALDRTVLAADAGRAIAPGESVTIELEWDSVLPRVRRRTGTKGDFLYVAQWFPKLGVYETGRGWNCHSFHAVTEFYADYGTYRVTLDLPREYTDKVGGSGIRTQNLVRGDRVEVVFEAPSRGDRERPDAFQKLPLVHDFAWTADPDYLVLTDTFRPAEWVQRFPQEVADARRAFGEGVDLQFRDVAMTLLLQPEHEGQAARHFEATAAALFFYGLWFGPYPYEHITIVDPAWGARAAGGMEYPTIFTCGTRLFTEPRMYSPESVTVHEAGHQFWYGLVGNNEFEAAWMDEGFNSFTDSEALVRVYGPSRATTDYMRLPHWGERATRAPSGGRLARIFIGRDWSLGFLKDVSYLDRLSDVRIDPLRTTGIVEWWRDQPWLSLVPSFSDPRWGDRSGYLRDPDSDPIDSFAFHYVDRQSYRTNSYPRPAAALRTLMGMIGKEAFLRGMRGYADAYRYGHPYPDDFFEAFIEHSGVDVRWYFEDAFRSRKTIDWSVAVDQARVPEEMGFFVGPEGELVERRPAEDEEAGDDEDDDAPSERPRRVEILLRRKGELCLPLPWQVTIGRTGPGAEGSAPEVRDFTWSREAQLEEGWHREVLELAPDQRVESVVLDPERVYYIDLDMSDNQWFAERDRVAPLRWAERTFNQYLHILHWYAGIGG